MANSLLKSKVRSFAKGILFRQSELLTAIQPTYPEVKGFEIKINPELTC